ncbi:hypothetical protein MKEN_00735900 [Mycena kentingensis (nom. inval.)]|nr:hypothetical protein MKEN_00735900 [Mycena kentingensis (nom. inval.)]
MTTGLAPALPPEVCGIICGLVDTQSLIALATVSRPFRHEAQRAIFHTVDLVSLGADAAREWRLAIRKNPRLSPGVTSVSFWMPPLSDAQVMTGALKKCKNIKRLAIWDTRADSTHTWIAEGPFRLRVFVNAALQLTPSSPFWKQQKHVRVLSFPLPADKYTKEKFPCRADQLPDLVAVDVVDLRMLPPAPRALERIQLNAKLGYITKGLRVTELARFAYTLTHLNMTGVVFKQLREILTIFLRAVPRLVHLGMSEPIEKWDPYYLPVEGQRTGAEHLPLDTLKSFEHLHSLVLYTFQTREFILPRIGDDPEHPTSSLADPTSVARMLMDDVPQLRTVTIASSMQNEKEGWSRMHPPERTVRTCTMRRMPEGGFYTDTDGQYCFDAVGRFWDA